MQLTTTIAAALFVLSTAAPARAEEPTVVATPSRGAAQEVSINLFRNPSIGLEYRLGDVSIHAGAYPTKIQPEEAGGSYPTTWFVRGGLSYYFLPVVLFGARPSEFYVSSSYLHHLSGGGGNALLIDAGYRLMLWRGLNVRLGAALHLERGEAARLRPTPGVGWSQAF